MVQAYSGALGFKIGVHALRATAATNALDRQPEGTSAGSRLGAGVLSIQAMTAPCRQGSLQKTELKAR